MGVVSKLMDHVFEGLDSAGEEEDEEVSRYSARGKRYSSGGSPRGSIRGVNFLFLLSIDAWCFFLPHEIHFTARWRERWGRRSVVMGIVHLFVQHTNRTSPFFRCVVFVSAFFSCRSHPPHSRTEVTVEHRHITATMKTSSPNDEAAQEGNITEQCRNFKNIFCPQVLSFVLFPRVFA